MSATLSYTIPQLADLLGVGKATISKWHTTGKLPITDTKGIWHTYKIEHLMCLDNFKKIYTSSWQEEMRISPNQPYASVELFTGAGGLALGLEQAGFNNVFANEIDKDACATLQLNRPNWHITKDDIKNIDFTKLPKDIDLLSGGFPCQAFSYAGAKRGFEDARGTLFFEYAKAVKILKPKVLLVENVRGLLTHDGGKTLKVILGTLEALGYKLQTPQILKAIFYQVPQKRERLIIVGIRQDLAKAHFTYPAPNPHILTLKDALKAGRLYKTDVPSSMGKTYPAKKYEVLKQVPQGGYWRDLPDDVQRAYMQKSYFMGGGKTGMARRLSWDEPSLTLTCSPDQKQTERCHPEDTRPLSVREYARIQTFPDEWAFCGSITSQYKQIGNAVPVNLAKAIGKQLIALLNAIHTPTTNHTKPQNLLELMEATTS